MLHIALNHALLKNEEMLKTIRSKKRILDYACMYSYTKLRNQNTIKINADKILNNRLYRTVF